MKKKVVKRYILSVVLYGAESWTLRKVDQKWLGSFELWCWRRIKKIGWTNCVRNDAVLQRVNERNIPQTHVAYELTCKTLYWRKEGGKDRSGRKTRKTV